MRKQFVVTLLVLLLAGCAGPDGSSGPVKKEIAHKIETIENRVSAWDTITSSNGGIRTKSRTVYYLVASDGLAVSVGLSEYIQYEVGDSLSSYNWRKVQ